MLVGVLKLSKSRSLHEDRQKKKWKMTKISVRESLSAFLLEFSLFCGQKERSGPEIVNSNARLRDLEGNEDINLY